MKEKVVEEITQSLFKKMSKEEQEKFKEMKLDERLEENIESELKGLEEDEIEYYLSRLKLGIEQKNSGMNGMDEKYVDMFSSIRRYIINIENKKEMYSLEELLGVCSLNQLDLYHVLYSYTFNVYDVKKMKDKKKLIAIIKKDILFNFKRYIRKARRQELDLFKNTLKNNGVMEDVNEDFIPLGYYIPFYTGKGKKIKYVMAKELMGVIEKHDFSVTSEETKKLVSELLEYFVASKGIASKPEVEEFIINVADLNIKKEELFEIANNKLALKDGYYYAEKIIVSNLFNELVAIKKGNPYMPSSEEIFEFELIIKDLFTLLMGIAGKEVKLGRILKDIFYKPTDVEVIVKNISKKLKIEEENKELLEEFLYENMYDFPYWIYNGNKEDYDEEPYDFGDLSYEDFIKMVE